MSRCRDLAKLLPPCIAALALALAGGLAACGDANQSSPFRPFDGTQAPPTPVDSKPNPPLGDADQRMVMFQELTRTQQTLRDLHAPKSRTQGCITYNATGSRQGLLMIASYKNCGWKQPLTTDANGMVYGIVGNETYQGYPATTGQAPYSEAKAAYTLKMNKGKAPASSQAQTSSFNHRVRLTPNESKTDAVAIEASWGTSDAVSEDYWTANIDNGAWRETDTDLVMASGTELVWKYRAASDKKNPAPVLEYHLIATEDVSFAAGCPWPVSGSFSWIQVDQSGSSKKGQVTVDAKGFSDGSIRVTWPTEHCLEKR